MAEKSVILVFCTYVFYCFLYYYGKIYFLRFVHNKNKQKSLSKI